MLKRTYWLNLALLIAAVGLVFARPVSAQENEFKISLRKNFGYGAGSNIRGNFTISLRGDLNQVISVEFLIDDEQLSLVEEAPFKFQFHTDRYGFGQHWLGARITLQNGQVETVSSVRVNFVTPTEERRSMGLIFGGMAAIFVLGLMIYGLVNVLVLKRQPKRKGAIAHTAHYGLLGAAICPKCGRPFPRHLWGFNMIVGKYDRCEHCGKWSITRRATLEEIEAAQEALLAPQNTHEVQPLAQQKVNHALDNTRYIDGL